MVIVEEDVVIVGAGIAGLATAVAMKRVGLRALVLERAEGLRATGAALSLFPNAWRALDALGVSHKLTSAYAPVTKGQMVNVDSGAIQELPFVGRDGIGNGPTSVHRKALLEALAEELPVGSIRFSSKLTAIEAQAQDGFFSPIIHMDDGTIIKAKVLIGCDGVHSMVARWLGLAKSVNSGRSAVRGLAVFPQGHGLDQQLHQYSSADKRVGIVSINHTEIYWYLTCKSPSKGDNMTGEPEQLQREILENYAQNFPPLYFDIIRHIDFSTLTWAPLLFRRPWDLIFGNLSKGNVTVAGDAMHPMTPELGQGGCAALEDAVVLGRRIGEQFIRHGRKLVPAEVAGAIKGYVEERRWRVARLIVVSYISGWVQQGGSAWWMKFFGVVYYAFLYFRFDGIISYDCGKLPSDTSCGGQLESSSKMD